MTLCGDCQFWQKGRSSMDIRQHISEARLGSCASPKWRQGYRVSLNGVADDEILVENDEGWAFLTGPKFGCIHGQAKE